ncbi:MAG: hypothetical protein SGJ27_12690, partial [Candidatus Melainabacteria bacterium]|nr:hypothetical protein [Candidatus Melainabacteria bacterium]
RKGKAVVIDSLSFFFWNNSCRRLYALFDRRQHSEPSLRLRPDEKSDRAPATIFSCTTSIYAYNGNKTTLLLVHVMAVTNVQSTTAEALKSDITAALKKEFGMTIPQFLQSVESGILSKSDNGVREILLWMRFIPTEDLLPPCPSLK